MRTPALTVRLFPLFAALSFTPVMVPGIVMFWQDNGLDTFEVFLLQAVFAVAVVVLEVPTGMVADRVGKRTSLLAGQVVVAIGSVLYALGTGFWSFLGAEVTLAVGMALLSGADAALLYDCLKQLGRESDFAAIESRTHALRLLSFALANVLGGFVIMYSLRGAMWASAVGPVLAVPIVACFAPGRQPARRAGFREDLAAYGELTTASLKFVGKHRLVRWFLAFQAVLSGSATWLLWSYQPYMTLVGIPAWAYGVLFATYNLAAAASSRATPWLLRRFSDGGVFLVLGALQALPPLLMAAFRVPLSPLFVLGHQAVRGLSRPIISSRVLAYTYADKRATVLSLGSLAGRLFFAFTGPVVGWVAAGHGLPVALAGQGVALVVIFAFLAWEYGRIPPKYRTVKGGVGDDVA